MPIMGYLLLAMIGATITASVVVVTTGSWLSGIIAWLVTGNVGFVGSVLLNAYSGKARDAGKAKDVNQAQDQ